MKRPKKTGQLPAKTSAPPKAEASPSTQSSPHPGITADPELGHGPILQIPLSEIHPAPENEKLYRPVRADDPEIIDMAKGMSRDGVLQPLIITLDHFISSGHRRYVAARLAGFGSVPCCMTNYKRCDEPERFLRELREHNRQREKSFDEKLREEIISINPESAYKSLIKHRNKSARVKVNNLAIIGTLHRAKISDAKQEFLDAILAVLEENKDFWPMSDRQIHYPLLNDPPLRHLSKPRSVYCNDKESYKSLVELLTRARLVGLIPMDAIADETRPVITWKTWPDVRGYIRSELKDLLKGYWRNLMVSQPNHIEILVEKNTVANIVKDVAMRYCIPMTSGRGFCSLPPRYQMAQRFKASGKEKLILLIASDFDPDGEEIAHSFARSMRDDFGIATINPIKVALTNEQVQRFSLPPQMVAKETSTNYAKFAAKYGQNVYELEAVPARTLQALVHEGIDSVIDTKLFNAELDQEKRDATQLEGMRLSVAKALQEGTAA